MDVIYVRLLEEGIDVYRPVPATRLESAIYVIDPQAPYDITDEVWEFPPGSRVIVTEKVLSEGMALVAMRMAP